MVLTLSILLLLFSVPAIFAEDVPMMQRAQQVGVSKRNMGLMIAPTEFIAMPLIKRSGAFAKRQECVDPDSFPCPMLGGCCKSGSVCGIYGGKKGCCPFGKSCNTVGGCQDEDYVPCIDIDHCCPPSYTCTVDGCVIGGFGGCDAGFIPCENSDGCCPFNIKCVPPAKCDVRCKPSYPKCGPGCCFEGFVCGDDLKCTKSSSVITRFTLADPLDTSTPTDEPTSSSEESTNEPTSSSEEPTDDSAEPTAPKISIIVSTTAPHVTSGLAAPTLAPGVVVLGFAAAGAVFILAI